MYNVTCIYFSIRSFLMKDELNELELNSKEETNDGWKFDGEAPTLQNTVLDNGEFEINIPATESNAQDVKPEPEQKPAPSAPAKPVSTDRANKKSFIATAVIMAVVLAVLVVLGVRYYTVPNSNEKMNPGNVALTVGDTDVSIGMYNYYYSIISQNYITYAGYGYYDLDPTVSFEQQSTTNSDGETVTWAQVFEDDTIDQIQYITAYYEQAVKAGIELSEEQKQTIEQQIDSLKASASDANQSVDEFISSNYGDYCGLATLNKMLEQCYIAESYYKEASMDINVTDDEIDEYYKENSDNYKVAPFAYLQIIYNEDSLTKEDAEARAKEAAESISTVDEMKKALPTVCKESLEQYVKSGYFEDTDKAAETIAENIETTIQRNDESFTQDGLEWLFDDNTKVGDCSYFTDESNSVVYVVLKTGDVSVDDQEVYSVRHILVMPESEEAENSEEQTEEAEHAQKTYTDEEWAAAEKKAQSILDEYLAGNKTERSFAELAEKYSADTESTSKGSSGVYGGLISGTKIGTMVPTFEEWSIDDSRKYGDTDIVKSDYGYHIMFFVEDMPQYLYDCKLQLISDKEKSFVADIKVKKHKSGMKKVKKAAPEASQGQTAEQTVPDATQQDAE